MALQPARFYVDDRPDEGVFRVHRDVYSDSEIFELGMKYIFERTWNFLTIESQLPKPNDVHHTFFGRAEYDLARRDENWLIAKKKTILENDRIPLPIDIYCL
jgi:3-phenylpropionate/cinnamic acid dioxygenase small subunit